MPESAVLATVARQPITFAPLSARQKRYSTTYQPVLILGAEEVFADAILATEDRRTIIAWQRQQRKAS